MVSPGTHVVKNHESRPEPMSPSQQAGTKVGPDQLGPPVRFGSTQIDSDQLGSNKKIKIK